MGDNDPVQGLDVSGGCDGACDLEHLFQATAITLLRLIDGHERRVVTG